MSIIITLLVFISVLTIIRYGRKFVKFHKLTRYQQDAYYIDAPPSDHCKREYFS